MKLWEEPCNWVGGRAKCGKWLKRNFESSEERWFFFFCLCCVALSAAHLSKWISHLCVCWWPGSEPAQPPHNDSFSPSYCPRATHGGGSSFHLLGTVLHLNIIMFLKSELGQYKYLVQNKIKIKSAGWEFKRARSEAMTADIWNDLENNWK